MTVDTPICSAKRARAGRMTALGVVLFLAALWAPLIGMFFDAGRFRSRDENRRLAPLPEVGRNVSRWIDLGAPFTAYLHDHFGFRGTLITAHSLVKVRLLGISSSPAVVIGKNGWLFLDRYHGELPFKPDELTAWVELFNRREDWLARRGILMIVAIAPDKHWVYPEFLSSSILRLPQPTRLDEFVNAMRSGSRVPVLDLRRALLDSKPTHSYLYFATDTHWNSWGAYAGYLEVMREVAKKYPAMKPLPFSQTPRVIEYKPGDLTRLLGLASVWRETMEFPVLPAMLHSADIRDGETVIRQAQAGNRRLVTFGDSFSALLMPYLAQHFGETVVSQSVSLDRALIAEHAPNVVLFEMVERKLNSPLPQDPAEPMERMDHQRRQ